MYTDTGSSNTLVPINYTSKDRLEEIADEIRNMDTTFSISAYELGQLCAEARDLAGNNFSKWIKPNTGYSRQHAYNYINIYQTFRPSNRQHVIRKVDKTGLMLLAQPKLEAHLDTILSELMKSASGPRLINSSTVRTFIQIYGPQKEYPEYEDEETGSLVIKAEAYVKYTNALFVALEKILEQGWTPESFRSARHKVFKHVPMPFFKAKAISDLEQYLSFAREVR